MTAVLIKSLAILLVAACLVLAVSAHKPEYAFLLSLVTGSAVLILIFKELLPQINTIRSAFDNLPGSAYFSVAIKALGISYLSEFIADTCRDFGQNAYAAKAELAGKCAIFIICVPPAISVLEAALKFAGI